MQTTETKTTTKPGVRHVSIEEHADYVYLRASSGGTGMIWHVVADLARVVQRLAHRESLREAERARTRKN